MSEAAKPDAPNSAVPLRVGLIGTGVIGSLHARILAREVPGATLAVVADAVSTAAERVAARLGVPTADPDSIFAADHLDAIAICSSTDTHAGYIVRACDAGRPVFSEKPISLDLAQVDRVCDVVRSTGVLCMTGFNRRFDPSHRAVADAVAHGEIGEPHLVRITSRDPEPPSREYSTVSGGIFLDTTIHDFDMARFVAGSEVVEVCARTAARVDAWLADLGDADTAVAMLMHENGCFTVIDNSRQSPYGYDQRVEVFGPGGMAASGNPPVSDSVVRTATGARLPGIAHFFLERYHDSYVREWRAFVDAVAAGAPSPVGVEDGRAAVVIGLAARLSAAERRPVPLSEIAPG